jgi:butyrate kinase
MYKIEESFDSQLHSLQKVRPAVVFTEPLDPRILEAVCYLTRFIRPVLLASEDEVRAAAAQNLAHMDPSRIDFALSECSCVDISGSGDLVEELAAECLKHPYRGFKGKTLEAARTAVREPGLFGIYAVRLGHADMVVGGARHSSRQFFRPMLTLLATRLVVMEAGVFILPDDHPEAIYPHNIAVFGDVGVNASMTPEVLAEVAVGTCALTRDLIPEEVLPEIHGAVVSYSHKGSDEGPSPAMIRKAMERVPELLAAQSAKGRRYASIRLAGEVKISAALSKRSAGLYAEAGLAGGTNVIICPNLETGNLLFHLYASRFPGAKKFAVLFGIGSRGVDVAIDCGAEDVRLAVKASLVRLHQRYLRRPRAVKDTFFRSYRVLAVNPGSTSTKIAVYDGEAERFTAEIQHAREELAPFAGQKVTEQYAMRQAAVARVLDERGVAPGELDAVCGRGGLLRPIPHGTYRVNEAILADLRAGACGDHASNLGALIAHELAAPHGKPAFIVDPVVVDEVPSRVKITGIKAVRRKIISHALNQIASVRRYAQENETFYEKINVVVCHLGGGISVGAHRRGHYIDVNNALDGEGPFTPERAGTLPAGQLAAMCFSGRHTEAEVKKLIKGAGGLVDLLGTSDLREVEKRVAAGDAWAAEVFDAMAYQIAKSAAALLPAFDGEALDRVILTGGMARCKPLVESVSRYLSGLGCGITVYAGENEMAALVKGALRVLYGREKERDYPPQEAGAQVCAQAGRS